MSDFIDNGIFDMNNIQVSKDVVNNHFVLSLNYKYNDIKKLITFFNSYPKFWYELKTHQILCNGNDIDDIKNKINILKSII